MGKAVRGRVLGGYGSYRLYSSLFVWLKLRVGYEDMQEAAERSLSLSPRLALPVPTHG